MEDKKHVDFISAIIFIILSVYVIFESMNIYKDAGELLYESPGLTPLILGVGLLICGTLLLVRSLIGEGIGTHIENLKNGAAEVFKSVVFRKALIGIALMLIYVFVLLELIGYTASSAVFMIVMMLFLNYEDIKETEGSSKKAIKVVKVFMIPLIVVAVTWVAFQKGFGVPLP